MKVIINELNYDLPFILKMPSRPNIGDRIYLNDLELIDVDPRFLKDIKKITAFVITDVVYGTILKYKKPRWILQGEFQD